MHVSADTVLEYLTHFNLGAIHMSFDIKELQLILLPGKRPPRAYTDQYLKAYNCWREVWEATYQKEMNIDVMLTSDEFTRQDEVLALFYKGECTATCFFKWVNADEVPTVHDSYFGPWPHLAFHKLRSRGPSILVCSQFSVHPKFRKNNKDLSWKDLVAALGIERFRYSDADAMTGTMRLKKNMGEVCYQSGGTPLMRGLPYGKGDEMIDLVGFFHDEVFDSPVPGVQDLVNAIYANVIALVNPIVAKRTKEVKRAA